MNTVKFT